MTAMSALDWNRIDTVLLDMDGTLLDLHFDNHFWQEHLPRRYSEQHGLSLAQARKQLQPHFSATAGTMEWYCIEYWSRTLALDIATLKEEVAHLIALQPHATGFLQRLRQAGKRRVLVTNAHPLSLTLKMRHTRLDTHLDAVICAHSLGQPKEAEGFWQQLQNIEPFDPRRTLLIDDNLAALRSAAAHGCAYLLAVQQPDSRRQAQEVGEFTALRGFHELLADIPTDRPPAQPRPTAEDSPQP